MLVCSRNEKRPPDRLRGSLDSAAREGQDQLRDKRSEETLLDVAVASVPEPSRSSRRDTGLLSRRLTHRQVVGGFGGAEPHFKDGFEETLIASCVHCEDSRSLRYDHDLAAWVCFDGCGGTQTQSEPQLKRLSPKKLQWKRSPLFENYAIEDGVRRKLRHSELREAYRLWAEHKDIREGRFRG